MTQIQRYHLKEKLKENMKHGEKSFGASILSLKSALNFHPNIIFIYLFYTQQTWKRDSTNIYQSPPCRVLYSHICIYI